VTATINDAAGGRSTEPPRHGPLTSLRPERPLPTPPLAPVVRSRRRPALLALGIALTATGALTTAWLVSHADARVSVVALARDVPYGSVVTAADLVVADVALDARIATVPAEQARTAVGQVAAVPLLAGTLLSPAALTSKLPPGPGEVLVALAIPASRMPAGSLSAGARVLMVSTPVRDADAPTSPPPTLRATVVRLGDTDLDGVTVVDVTVPAAEGPIAASWSATGRIALILESGAK
jgi:hypothetical protein